MVIRRTIKRIIDGDTIKVSRRIRGTYYIRIAGINAPERGRLGYSSARARLSKLRGKVVSIIPKGRSYNRLVAEIRYKKKRII